MFKTNIHATLMDLILYNCECVCANNNKLETLYCNLIKLSFQNFFFFLK